MVQACCCPQLAKYSEGQTELEEIIIIVSVMHCWSYKGNLAFNPVADFSRDYILARLHSRGSERTKDAFFLVSFLPESQLSKNIFKGELLKVRYSEKANRFEKNILLCFDIAY